MGLDELTCAAVFVALEQEEFLRRTGVEGYARA
jgi:hypothetical protein